MARFLEVGTVCATVGLLWCAVASANPMMSEIYVIRQQPGTHHVQVTFGTYQGVDQVTLGELKRDGVVVPATWSSTIGFSKNTGSGVRSTSSRQICDCDLPLGAHTYEFLAGGTLKTGGCTVVDSLGEPVQRDAGPDAMPWDIPDPVGWQGLSCISYCGQQDAAADAADGALATGGNAEAGGSSGKGGGAATGGGVGGDAGTSSSGGCSVQVAASNRAHYFAGALIAVGVVLSRRRRARR